MTASFAFDMNKDKHKILLVDNEQGFLDSLKEFLQEENYEVYLAKNGLEGIELLNNEGPFSVIISDYRMPKMLGDEFLEHAKKLSSNTPRVLVTAYQDARLVSESINESDVFAFIHKPINLDSLKDTVLSATKKYQENFQAIHRHRILFVGSNIGLRDLTRDELLKKGFNLQFAQNREEIEAACKAKTPIAVFVVSDLGKGLDGIKFLELSKANFPRSIRILLTDSSNLPGMKKAINEIGVYKILIRPFDINQIEEVLKSAILKYDQIVGESLLNRFKDSV